MIYYLLSALLKGSVCPDVALLMYTVNTDNLILNELEGVHPFRAILRQGPKKIEGK